MIDRRVGVKRGTCERGVRQGTSRKRDEKKKGEDEEERSRCWRECLLEVSFSVFPFYS